jgi:hypothetical protein
MARLDGFGCFYCGLPVRFTGDHRHPGYVIIDHIAPAAPRIDSQGLPDLHVLHRFCSRVVKATRDGPCSSITLRRAWLGWATSAFEAGRNEKHYGTKHFVRLGLHPGRLRAPGLFRKYWRIRKMCCATHACRYYSGSATAHGPLHSDATPG